MKTFTLGPDHRILAHSTPPARTPGTVRFTSMATFSRAVEDWPAGRLVAVWNALPGVPPVKRFASREAAVTRIWKQVEPLQPAAPAKAPQAQPRTATKAHTVIGLLRRENGASLAELQAATGWQPHTVRGFLSGVLSRKLGVRIESTRQSALRIYRITD